MQHTPASFDAKFATDADPWRFRSSWYEARKRALTLACLTKERYASGFEPGCANGELSAALAPRCDRLIVSDGSTRAVDLARARSAASPHVQVRQAWVPDEWPEERFDLIVVSELGYFLTQRALDTLVSKARASLLAGGTVLACHWRRGSDDCDMDGDEVHRRIGDALRLPLACQVMEPDFRIDVWSDDAVSIAQREGLGVWAAEIEPRVGPISGPR